MIKENLQEQERITAEEFEVEINYLNQLKDIQSNGYWCTMYASGDWWQKQTIAVIQAAQSKWGFETASIEEILLQWQSMEIQTFDDWAIRINKQIQKQEVLINSDLSFK